MSLLRERQPHLTLAVPTPITDRVYGRFALAVQCSTVPPHDFNCACRSTTPPVPNPILGYFTSILMDQKVTDKKAAQVGSEPPQLVDDVSGFVYNPAEVRDRVGAGVRVGIRVGVRPPASSTAG